MKLLIGTGALILLFAWTAGAQSFGSYVGGGSSINSGASLNGAGGLGSVSFHSAPSNPGPFFHMSVTSGSDGEFIPSTFVAFAKAVEMGRMMQAEKPKSLAAVALEYRAQKKAKTEIAHPVVMDMQGSRQE